jgi:hypothetical protein
MAELHELHDRAAELNQLPDSHWAAWHDDERNLAALIVEHRAKGLAVDAAYDAAINDHRAGRRLADRNGPVGA